MKEIGKFLPKWRILQFLMLFSDFITDHVFYLFTLVFLVSLPTNLLDFLFKINAQPSRLALTSGVNEAEVAIDLGYQWDGDKLVTIPEESEMVKRIFQNFLDRKSRLEAERELAADGIKTRSGTRIQ